MNASRDKTWIEILLPLIVILGAIALAMIWNILAAVVFLFFAAVLFIVRYIQRKESGRPGQ